MNMVVKEKQGYRDELDLKLAQLPFPDNGAKMFVGIFFNANR
jgi:hypothetical protein